jgi:hypothetical protein
MCLWWRSSAVRDREGLSIDQNMGASNAVNSLMPQKVALLSIDFLRYLRTL